MGLGLCVCVCALVCACVQVVLLALGVQQTWLFYLENEIWIDGNCIFPIMARMIVCPAERRVARCASLVHRALAAGTAGCVVLCGNNRIPDSFLTASQWPIFWRNARTHEKKPSEVVPAHESLQNPMCLPRGCVSFVSGLIVAREEFLHLPSHAYMHGLYISAPVMGFFSPILPPRPAVGNHQPQVCAVC